MIKTTGLTKQFGNIIAVDAINLHVPKGAAYGLVGPNGAGKTTTLRMLATLEEPDSGRAFIGGHEALSNNKSVHTMIGFMNDFFALNDELYVWEYLEYFGRCWGLTPEVRAERIEALLAKCNLSGKRNNLVGDLSRGMRQRLYLAKTLLHDPEVLLMDEPASGLDPKSRAEFRDIIIAEKERGKTILISSHILNELSDFCDYIGVMEKGRLIESGNVATIGKERKKPRGMKLELTENIEAAIFILEKNERVSSIEQKDHQINFKLAGDKNAAAELLAELVKSDASVAYFAPTQSQLEEVFMDLDHHEVQ